MHYGFDGIFYPTLNEAKIEKDSKDIESILKEKTPKDVDFS